MAPKLNKAQRMDEDVGDVPEQEMAVDDEEQEDAVADGLAEPGAVDRNEFMKLMRLEVEHAVGS